MENSFIQCHHKEKWRILEILFDNNHVTTTITHLTVPALKSFENNTFINDFQMSNFD